ncbi:BRO-N domain-containing protein [Pectobacterium versatile]|uniref:BRO-N domain-containing protein n=1 Tax=Pectobacterium versatile TaxID=2488639 RepID=UPI00102E3371|nr:BRO family protein [Pectobacterium versatile]TAI99800.1 hypothetical protein EG332_04110 [Pectobacterium versatile]UEQ10451.1 hypothetical protein LLE50_04895 [Pectobacterium versatile]
MNPVISPISFSFQETHQFRVTVIDNEPWFCLKDICSVLDIKNISQLSAQLDQKGICKTYTPTNGGNQHLVYVSERNLYRAIFRSNKPEARQFQDWVYDEVLPSIRKTGKYEVAPAKPKPRALPRKLAKDNISRMPFINLHSETPHWAIPSVGGYFRGYEVGEAMAYLFLKFLNENRVPAEVGFKYYTDIMFSLFHRYELEGGHAAEVERSEAEGFTSIRGQLAGFMNTTSKWLIVAANGMDNEARRFTEAQLLEKTNAALGSGVKALQFRA